MRARWKGNPAERKRGGVGFTRIIELASLADGKTSRANDENLLHIDMIPGLYHTALKVGFRVGGGLGSARA